MVTHKYKTEVFVVLEFDITAESQNEAAAVARQLASAHRIQDHEVEDITAVVQQCPQAECMVCRPNALKAMLDAENLRLYLEHEAIRLGTDSQRERYFAGVLPEEELTQIARAELFKPFTSLTKRAKMRAHLIPHAATCGGDASDIVWSSSDSYSAMGLDAEEWQQHLFVAGLADAAKSHPWLFRSGGGVRVTARQHRGTCRRCEGFVAEHSVMVAIDWAGRVLTREYAL